jgi:DNA-binding NtrC family response regulator
VPSLFFGSKRMRCIEPYRCNVLIVDDELPVRTALEASFRRQGWPVQTAASVNDALVRFRRGSFQLLITDMRLPDGTGLALMREIHAAKPDVPVILLIPYGGVGEAVEAMKVGVCDYLVKPVSNEQLQFAALRILSRRQEFTGNSGRELIGNSQAFRRAVERACQAARTDADILIEAESGTGKELLARLIHGASARHDRAFVAVNCAALPESLLESELYGHVRGAFTGAIASKRGKFEQANGGTLLLDEIGEMPLSLQAKLLRVLQEREIDRLGDTKPVKIDVRVVATTNRSLRQLVAERTFRSDLYYRLNVIPLTLPPLRERREDVSLLARHFCREYTVSGRKVPTLSNLFIRGLERYSWPGNVRELANFMRRVVVLSSTSEIGPEYLDPVMFHESEGTRKEGLVLEPGLSLRDAERRLLEVTLEATAGNRTRAAEMLGVSLRTIRNKIRDFGLPRRSYA